MTIIEQVNHIKKIVVTHNIIRDKHAINKFSYQIVQLTDILKPIKQIHNHLERLQTISKVLSEYNQPTKSKFHEDAKRHVEIVYSRFIQEAVPLFEEIEKALTELKIDNRAVPLEW